jgi:type I restriction enzyme S subunit
MASEWPVRRLGDISTNLDAKRKPVKEADRVAGPYPYYGASGVVDHVDGYLFDGEYVLVAEDGENLRTRNTPFAFRAKDKFWVNNHAHILRGNDNASTPYLEYALLASDISGYLTGAVMPKLTQGNLSKIELPCPPRHVQDEIVGVLGALDDRADNLRQTNATLEAIAQALFKSWFVDFEPVRVKAEGREPKGMDPATAALFPSEFEDSELGAIPKGWCVNSLGKISQNIREQAKPEELDPDTHYIGLEHMPRKSIALMEHGVAEGLASGKFWYRINDILFGKLRPYFHKVGVAMGSGVCSTDILVIRPVSRCWFGYVTMQFSGEALVSHAAQLSNGAKMPRTNWSDLANYRVALPGDEIALAFDAVIRPLISGIHANIASAKALVELRDTLLPRLISGKLRLPEAEALADEIA